MSTPGRRKALRALAKTKMQNKKKSSAGDKKGAKLSNKPKSIKKEK